MPKNRYFIFSSEARAEKFFFTHHYLCYRLEDQPDVVYSHHQPTIDELRRVATELPPDAMPAESV